ncbi:hypothetical protein JHS3_21940 [Jeongeupia sp. HS-3]|nr:hypothetical protein JHS3_21940 [Jeongeupia sp. HS-3]
MRSGWRACRSCHTASATAACTDLPRRVGHAAGPELFAGNVAAKTGLARVSGDLALAIRTAVIFGLVGIHAGFLVLTLK